MIQTLFLLNILMLISQSLSLSITKSPADQYAALSSNVVFKCHISGYNPLTDLIEWCKNDFCTWGRAIEMFSGNFKYKSLPRYNLLVNRTLGEWSLMIENVTERDIGQFKCIVTRRNETSLHKVESSVANLRLLSKPKSAELSRMNTFDIVLNKQAEISCMVEEGMPAPNIYWALFDSSLLNRNKISSILENKRQENNTHSFMFIDRRKNFQINFTTQLLNGPNSYRHTSQLTLNGTLDLIDKHLMCIVEHHLLKEPVINLIKIQLKYPPILSISHETNEHLIENKTYKFFCKSHAQPSQIVFKQMLLIDSRNYSHFLNQNEDFVELKMNRSLNGCMLRCKQENAMGQSVSEFKLDVLFKPIFIEKPDAIILASNVSSENRLELKCRASSNPESTIFWYKNEHQLVHIGETIALQVNRNLDGEYTCQAKSPGFDAIAHTTSIISNRLPTLFGKAVYFIKKNTNELKIEFKALSNPSYLFDPVCTKISENTLLPIDILVPIKNSQRKIETTKEDLQNLKLSTKFVLKIKNPVKSDIGFYNCTLKNVHGSGFYNFEIRKNDDGLERFITALGLSIFFLILITILMLLIFVMFCIYRKKYSINKDFSKKSLPRVSDISYNLDSKTAIKHGAANDFNILDINGRTISEILVQNLPHLQNYVNYNVGKSLISNNPLNYNQVSLIEQNLESNSFSFESLPNSSTSSSSSSSSADAQNLMSNSDAFRPSNSTLLTVTHQNDAILSNRSHSSTPSKIYQPANIYSSRFQTNV